MKAILKIEIPNDCYGCKFLTAIDVDYDYENSCTVNICSLTRKEANPEGRNEDCPLKTFD